MFSCILFDLDGTISDPKQGICGCVQYALRSFGIEEPELDRLEPFIGPPLAESFIITLRRSRRRRQLRSTGSGFL